MCAGDAREGLDRRVRDAEQDARGGPQHDAVMLEPPSHPWPHQQQAAEPEQAGLEGDHRRLGELRVGACIAGKVSAKQHQPGGGER